MFALHRELWRGRLFTLGQSTVRDKVMEDLTHYWTQVSRVNRVGCVACTGTVERVVPLVGDSATSRNVDDRLVIRGDKRVNTTIALHEKNGDCQYAFQRRSGHPNLQ
jgi:hypothetical protein